MAKKTKFELDEYGFNSDLDIPDFNFDSKPLKDDRKPVTKFAKSMVKGARETAVSPAFIRKVVRESLPRGYGQAMDLADESAGTLKSLYNTTTKEIKPALNEIKRTTKRIMPAADKILPRSVSERIKKWTNVNENSASLDAAAQRESSLQMQLGDIFKYQAEDGARRDAVDDIKDKLREGIEQSRHRDQLTQLDAIRTGITQLTSYQDKVNSNYQRKSLELQYRHYFVAMDMLEEQKKFSATAQTELEMIRKNTGLPDFVKLNKSESLQQIMRNRFMESLNDGIFGKRRDFIKNVGQKLAGAVKDKVSGFMGNVKTGLDSANMIMDMHDMQKEMGMQVSPAEMMGGVAGNVAMNSAGGKLGRWVGKRLGKNNRIVQGGNRLAYAAENLPQMAGEWARGDKGDHGFGGSLIRFGKDIVGSALSGPATGLNIDRVNNMQDPTVYNRQANKSITEIIPGFLARIYQELQIMRTGNTGIELTTYDYNSNKFSKASAVKKAAFATLIRGGEKASTTEELDELLKKVDPDGKLTKEQRSILGQHLLNENLNNRLGSAKRLSDASQYDGKASRHAGIYADLFSDHFKNDTSGAKQLDFSRDFSRIGGRIEDNRKLIQEYANSGQLEFLQEAGIVDASGNIDMEKLREYHYEGNYNPEAAGSDHEQTAGTGFRKRGPTRKARAKVTATHSQNHRSAKSSTGNKDLIEAIRATSTRDVEEQIHETLLRMEHRLNEGLITIDGTHLQSAGGKAGHWYNQSIKGAAGNLWNKGAAGLRKGQAYAKGMFNQALSTGSNLFNKARGLATAGLGYAKDKITGFNDVYIKGEIIPRIQSAKLRLGQYYVIGPDGKPQIVKSIKDITGDVFDSVSGKMVMGYEDAKNAFVKTGLGAKMLNGIAKLKDNVLYGVGRFTAMIPPAYRMGLELAKKAYNFVLDGPQDVYVKGKPDPVLLAITMKAGGYASRVSSKEIRKVSDIDGPVVDYTGNVILSQEDIAAGLLDKRGRPLKTGLAKLIGSIKDGAMAGFNAIKKGAQWLKGKAHDAWSGITGLFGKMIGKDGIVLAGGKTMLDRLTEIRDLLDQRLPRRKRAAGDADGDGVRDGSYDDLMRKREASKAAASAGPGDKSGDGPGGRTGIMALLDRLRGRNKNKGDQDEEKDSSSSGIDINVGGDAEKAAKKIPHKSKPVPKGFWNKTKHYGGKFAKGAWGATKWAGKAGLALMGLDGLGLGAMGAGLLSGAGTALAATGGAVMSGIGMLGTGLAAAGGLIASVLTAPVLLGAAAVAAIGIGGYLAYKYLTRKKLEGLNKLRYVQYGFLPTDNDHFSALMKLEEQLEKVVTWSGSTPNIDATKVKVKDLFESFGVDPADETAAGSWLRWYTGRFKPVYLTHLAAMKSVAPDKGLGDAEGLKPAEKKKFLNLAKFPEGPYNVLVSPFADLKQLAAGKEEVNTVVEELTVAFDKDAGDDKTTTMKEAGASAATVSTVAANMATTGAKNDGGTGSKTAGGVGGAGTPNTVGAGLAVAAGLAAATDNTTIQGTFAGFDRGSSGRLDALTCIRYKTYGLSEMVLEKVRAIDMLESLVKNDISYNAKGSATWTGSVETILGRLGSAFGIEGTRNNNATEWQSWFSLRFLPVFLNYAGALKSQTKKEDISAASDALNAQQQVDVAMVIYTTNNSDGMSVWTITNTPWPGFQLNTDVTTVESNVQGLKETAKKMVLDESKGTKDKAGLGSDNGTGITDGTATKKGFWGNVADSLGVGVKTAWNTAKQTAKAAGAWVGNVFGGSKDSGTSTASMGGGKQIDAVGKGSGGAIDDMPQPKGKGTWNSVKDLILSAAKMVGVDGKLMATMAAIESGFDWTVKAGTSSATGLYQFVSSTWNTMLKKYGAKYGIAPGTPATDPRANALMGAEYVRENAEALKSALNRPLTDTDLYIAHFMGAGGAKKFLTADPSSIAANLMPDAARANPSIFYKDGKPLTVAEVYAVINGRVRKKGKEFGLDAGSEEVKNDTATTTTTTAAALGTAAGSGAATIPITQQTPGVVAPDNAGPSTTTTAVSTSSGGLPPAVDPAVAAASGGFTPVAAPPMSPRAQSLKAQAQDQRDSVASAMGTVSDTLTQSLGVQQSQLDILTKIFEVIRAGGSAGSNAGAVGNKSSSGPARAMPAAPVSMAKPA